jgi:phage antirepressor YoqD-like protein
MTQLLPILNVNSVDVIDSRIVAQEVGIQHKNLYQLIKVHQNVIEIAFGSLRFETETIKREVGATVAYFVYLTEDQSLFVVTLCRNTEASIKLKSKLVQSFSDARKKLAEFKVPTNYLEALQEIVRLETLRIEHEEEIKIQKEITNVVVKEKEFIEKQNSIMTEVCITQKEILEEQKPKVESFNELMDSEGNITIGNFAKCLSRKGGNFEGLGPLTLFKFLREKKFLFKEGGENKAYQKYINDGTFIMITKPLKGNPHKDIYTQVLITSKGMWKIWKLLKNINKEDLI